MYLKKIEIAGFKSFVKKDVLSFTSPISAIVGPNGSGKSNIAEAFRFVLGEQSMKSMRGRRGEDLIFNGSPSIPRVNRASVKVFFDNSKRFLDIDYDEVVIERTVHRDGINQYIINGSQVRLKDVIELLAHANIGSSGHHIISQGESDRILNAGIRERREMIEDALGLKIFQYKKQESERKLSKTGENIAQVMSLRKEISPHLMFLERQVKKIEKSFAMRDEVKELYNEYLKREDEYLKYQRSRIEQEKKEPAKKLIHLERKLAETKELLSQGEHGDKKGREVIKIEEDLGIVRTEKDAKSRELGRIEGQLVFEERRRILEAEKQKQGVHKMVPLKEVEELVGNIKSDIEKVQKQTDISKVKTALSLVIDTLKQFLSIRRTAGSGEESSFKRELETLSNTKEELEDYVERLAKEEDNLMKAYESLRREVEAVKDESRMAEREMFHIMSEQSELRGKLNMTEALEERVHVEMENFEREITEARVLVGKAVIDFLDYHVVDKEGNKLDRAAIVKEPRTVQEERRRAIEKIKIRLEDVGGGTGDDTMTEFKEAKERDDFLGRELEDLKASAQSLGELISELEKKLDVQFKEGISKINAVFQNFFSILFDGGTAHLSVVKELRRARLSEELEAGEEASPEESYEGIEVHVNLPHKRIKGLEMLSGGERALTSIALLFAMSQVNPPPFIILDETDAALDEANSRKYGDMIENLSKSSQLILITHNRETMSRAGVLYGITMGSDGVSKLLSVRLEEAVQTAK